MFSSLIDRILSKFLPHPQSVLPQDSLLGHEKAGLFAESKVRKALDAISTKLGNTAVIHSGLFVFDRNTADEFSVEVDHLFITSNNIYLIETKFKSGVVYAPPNKPFWKVMKKGGYVPFRNGLKQAQNSALALQRRIDLPVKLVPLVVMIGAKLKIHGNNDQVVAIDELGKTIEYLEAQSRSNASMSPQDLREILSQSLSTDPLDVLKHRERVANVKVRNSVKLAKHLHRDKPFVIH